MVQFRVLIFAVAAISSAATGAQQSGTGSLQPKSGEQGSLSNIAFSEQAGQTPDPRSSTAAAVPVPSTANSPEVSNSQLRPVAGELEGKLDTKIAKTGDSVVLRTTERASTAHGVVIPKGSKIVGHVTDVEAKGKSGTTPVSQSSLTRQN